MVLVLNPSPNDKRWIERPGHPSHNRLNTLAHKLSPCGVHEHTKQMYAYMAQNWGDSGVMCSPCHTKWPRYTATCIPFRFGLRCSIFFFCFFHRWLAGIEDVLLMHVVVAAAAVTRPATTETIPHPLNTTAYKAIINNKLWLHFIFH